MAENSTIARPYAEAVFSLAESQGKLAEWSEMLQLITTVSSNDALSDLVGNPRVGQEKLVDLIVSVCGDSLDEHGQNLIKILVENGRLAVLPEISQHFETYKAEAEKTVQAEMVSAFPVSDKQKARVAEALKNRLGRDVKIECRIDETLIGGAIIRANDMVIDGSVSGKLEKLANALSH